jgi:hypothetical protein
MTGGASDSSPCNLRNCPIIVLGNQRCQTQSQIRCRTSILPREMTYCKVALSRIPVRVFATKFCIFSACECRKGTPVPVTLFKRKIFLKDSCSIRVSLSSCTYLNSTSKHYSHSGLHSRLPNPIPSNLNTYIAPASLWEPEFGITLRNSRTALVGHSKSLKW